MSMKMRFVSLIAATLVVTIGWYAIAFHPAQARLGAVRADVKRTQDEVTSLTAKLQELQGLKKNDKAIRAEAKRFADALPVTPAVSDFILDLQDVANQAGIDFLSISPSIPAAAEAAVDTTATPSTTSASPSPAPNDATAATAPAPVSPLRSIAVAVTANGKFFEIESFVAKMEKLKRAMRIDDFSLTVGAATSDSTNGAAAAAPTSVGSSPDISLSVKLQMFMNRPVAPVTAPITSTTTSGS